MLGAIIGVVTAAGLLVFLPKDLEAIKRKKEEKKKMEEERLAQQ